MIVAILFVALVCILIGILMGRRLEAGKTEELRKESDLNLFKGVCWHRRGEDHIYGPFYIISVDNCQTWNIVEENGEITGFAERKFPGLVDRLEGVRELAEYLNQEGEKAFLTQRGQELIRKAGLTMSGQK